MLHRGIMSIFSIKALYFFSCFIRLVSNIYLIKFKGTNLKLGGGEIR